MFTVKRCAYKQVKAVVQKLGESHREVKALKVLDKLATMVELQTCMEQITESSQAWDENTYLKHFQTFAEKLREAWLRQQDQCATSSSSCDSGSAVPHTST